MWSYAGKSRSTTQRFDPPLCWIPVKTDRSPAEELWVTSDRWGPLPGKILHTSYGTGKLFVVMSESIGEDDGASGVSLRRLASMIAGARSSGS